MTPPSHSPDHPCKHPSTTSNLQTSSTINPTKHSTTHFLLEASRPHDPHSYSTRYHRPYYVTAFTMNSPRSSFQQARPKDIPHAHSNETLPSRSSLSSSSAYSSPSSFDIVRCSRCKFTILTTSEVHPAHIPQVSDRSVSTRPQARAKESFGLA